MGHRIPLSERLDFSVLSFGGWRRIVSDPSRRCCLSLESGVETQRGNTEQKKSRSFDGRPLVHSLFGSAQHEQRSAVSLDRCICSSLLLDSIGGERGRGGARRRGTATAKPRPQPNGYCSCIQQQQLLGVCRPQQLAIRSSCYDPSAVRHGCPNADSLQPNLK